MSENHARLSPALVETIAGLSAGTISTLAVHPLDVIKTRLQSQAPLPFNPLAKPPLTLSSPTQHVSNSYKRLHDPPLPTLQYPPYSKPLPWPHAQPNRQCQFVGFVLLLQIPRRNPTHRLPRSTIPASLRLRP